jgi:hypothetical protein
MHSFCGRLIGVICYLCDVVYYVYVVVYCLAFSRIDHLRLRIEKWVDLRLVGGVTGARGLSRTVALPGGVRYKTLVIGWRQVVLEPRVSPKLLGGGAVVGVDLHAPHDDVARAKRNVIWNIEIAGANFRVKFFVILSSVWKLATEKGE